MRGERGRGRRADWTTRTATYLSLALLTACLLCLAAFGASSDTPDVPTSGVVIGEACPSNKRTAYDDDGEYGADYIELFNTGDEAVDLTGWGVSDDKDEPYKFVLPQVELAAHEGVVLWCDDKAQDWSLYQASYVPRDVHGLGFGLSGGEGVYLTDAQGEGVARVALPDNVPDGLSWQTTSDHLGSYVTGTATLYALAESADEIRPDEEPTLATPTFSLAGGWFDAPVQVELSCERGEVHYTLDGSEPDASSPRYDGPIEVTNRSDEPNRWASVGNISLTTPYLPSDPVDKATVIKAVAVEGDETSAVAAQTYFVGLDSAAYEGVSVVSLTLDPKDLFGYHDGIYQTGHVMDSYLAKYGEAGVPDANYVYRDANYAMEGVGWERAAQLEYLDASHERQLSQRIGLRIHGGFSVASNQKGFNLYARAEYDGSDSFRYAFFGHSFSKLMLRTGGLYDCYLTKLRDVLCQSLVADRDLGCQEAEPCAVFLNGEYWGLYNLQETVGEDYVEEVYGLGEGEAIVLKNPWELYESDPDAQLYQEVVDYAASHDLSEEENYAWIEDHLDIQGYLDYLCFQVYVANCDSIDNNYAVWRSRDDTGEGCRDGRWRFLLYDTDDSCACNTAKTSAGVDSFVDGHYTNLLGENADPLFSALVANDEFRERFVTTFMDLANQNFDYGRVHAALYALAERYCAADVASQRRFRGDLQIEVYQSGRAYDGTYTDEDFWADVRVIDDFFRERKAYIVSCLQHDLDVSGELVGLDVSCEGGEADALRVNTLTLPGDEPWGGQYFSGHAVSLGCDVPEGYEFVRWEANGQTVSREPRCELVLDGDTTVVAVLRKA